MISFEKGVDLKYKQKPVVEITNELLHSFIMLPMMKRIEKIASYYEVSMGEAAEINILLLLPAITV